MSTALDSIVPVEAKFVSVLVGWPSCWYGRWDIGLLDWPILYSFISLLILPFPDTSFYHTLANSIHSFS